MITNRLKQDKQIKVKRRKNNKYRKQKIRENLGKNKETRA